MEKKGNSQLPHIPRINTARLHTLIVPTIFWLSIAMIIGANLFLHREKNEQPKPKVLGVNKVNKNIKEIEFWEKVKSLYPEYMYSELALSKLSL